MIKRERSRVFVATIVFATGIASALASKDDDPTAPDDDAPIDYTDREINVLQVNEQAGVLSIIADGFKSFSGAPTVYVNGQPFSIISRKDSLIQIQIPFSGPQSIGDVEVQYSGSTPTRFKEKLLAWSGTVTNTFSKDGLTSNSTYRLRFRGSLPRGTRYRLYASAMRESRLESWDVGGSNSVVRSRQKTCAGSSAWTQPDSPPSVTEFWATMEIRQTASLVHDVNFFGTGGVGSCVRETFSDGSSMTTAAAWPFVGLTTRVGAFNWISGGTAGAPAPQGSGYMSAWSTFACENCPQPALSVTEGRPDS